MKRGLVNTKTIDNPCQLYHLTSDSSQFSRTMSNDQRPLIPIDFQEPCSRRIRPPISVDFQGPCSRCIRPPTPVDFQGPCPTTIQPLIPVDCEGLCSRSVRPLIPVDFQQQQQKKDFCGFIISLIISRVIWYSVLQKGINHFCYIYSF